MEEGKMEIAMGEPSDRVRVLNLRGRVGRTAEGPLLAAWQEASRGGAEAVILNFREVEALDSYGLSLLIRLQAMARRQKQRLVACGLSDSVQQAFAVTYLDEAVEVFADEAEALQRV